MKWRQLTTPRHYIGERESRLRHLCGPSNGKSRTILWSRQVGRIWVFVIVTSEFPSKLRLSRLARASKALSLLHLHTSRWNGMESGLLMICSWTGKYIQGDGEGVYIPALLFNNKRLLQCNTSRVTIISMYYPWLEKIHRIPFQSSVAAKSCLFYSWFFLFFFSLPQG